MGQKLQWDDSQVQSHRGHRTFGKACVPGTDLGTVNYRETKSLSSCHGHSNEPASLQEGEKSNGQDGVVSRPWSQLALRERLEATRAMSREQNVQIVHMPKKRMADRPRDPALTHPHICCVPGPFPAQ